MTPNFPTTSIRPPRRVGTLTYLAMPYSLVVSITLNGPLVVSVQIELEMRFFSILLKNS